MALCDTRRRLLIDKIRSEGRVFRRGRMFDLRGYTWHGIDLDPNEWQVEFILDKNFTGVLKDPVSHHVKIYSPFSTYNVFNGHREGENEYIGIHRTSKNSTQGYDTDSESESDGENGRKIDIRRKRICRKRIWNQPCNDPVFCFRSSVFEDYVHDKNGVIIIGDEKEAEEVSEANWSWICHRKKYSINEACDKCEKWYCYCPDKPLHESSIPSCKDCGAFNPNFSDF